MLLETLGVKSSGELCSNYGLRQFVPFATADLRGVFEPRISSLAARNNMDDRECALAARTIAIFSPHYRLPCPGRGRPRPSINR